MENFKSDEFIKALEQATNNRIIPSCPYCGGNNFTTTDSFSSIIIGKNPNSLTLGTSIPAGMVICSRCGHIEFFALGALGLLPKKENTNGES